MAFRCGVWRAASCGSRQFGSVASLLALAAGAAVAVLLAAVGLAATTHAAEAPALPGGAAPSRPTGADEAIRMPLAGDPRVQQALTLLRSGDTEGCLATLRAAVAANPEMSRPQVIIAQYMSLSNQGELARNALEQAVADDPADPEAYVILGDISVRERRPTEALLLYGKGLELAVAAKTPGARIASMRSRAAAGAGQLAESRRDWKAAQGYWEALAAGDPKSIPARQAAARALLNQDKPEAAFEKLQEAAALDTNPGPQSPALPEAVMAQLYHERAKMVAPDRTRGGLSQQQQEDERKAGEWLVKAITKAPSDLKTRLYAAQWALDISPWYGAKKLDEAVKQAQSALKIDPDSIAAKLLLAQTALIKRDYPGAEKLLLEAHAAAPSNGTVAGSLAISLAEQSDAAKRRLALEYAQLAARAMGDHPEASIPLAWALYRSGRLEEAQQVIAPAVSSGNRPSPDTVFLLAKLLADRGRKSEAHRILERGVADMSIGNMFLMREAATELLKELTPATSPK